MSYVSLALAVLKFVNLLMDYVNREKLLQEGRDEEIAAVTAQILRKTEAGRKIMEKVDAMDAATVDAELRKLEPQ